MLTLRERCSATLGVLRRRREEIAGVLVSPLQGLAVGDADVPAVARAERAAYRRWLHELRTECSKHGLPLLFDESATGFRLCVGGAQDYFGVDADVVCYGRSAGGGLPLGVVCGPRQLLASPEPRLPLRAGATQGSGGAAEHAALMHSAHTFLSTLGAVPTTAHTTAPDVAPTEPRAPPDDFEDFEALGRRAERWAEGVNVELRRSALPMRIVCERSVWAIRHLQPSRHHFLLMAYLAKHLAGQRTALEWIGPRRLVVRRHTSDAELGRLQSALVQAAADMVADGWWAKPEQVLVRSQAAIQWRIAQEVGVAVGARLVAAIRSFVSLGAQ